MSTAEQPEQPPGPSYPIASVDNALRLLRLVSEREQLRLSDASRYLDVAHSTAHRLLAMLAHHGFIRQDLVSKCYLPGPALLEIGLAAVQKMDIRVRVRPALEGLAALFDESVHLAVLEGDRIRYLDSIESTKALRVTSRIGATYPAHCTSVGKALLADFSPTELDQIYPAGPLPPHSARSVKTREELDAQLAEIRRRGYGVSLEESEEGVASVAVALRNGEGRAIASLNIAAPIGRMTSKRRREVAEALKDTARQLSL